MKTKHIKDTFLLGAILLISLSSCQVTKRYSTPKLSIDDIYRDEASTDTATIANIPWMEFYSDPILQGYIQKGLSNNHDMLITQERIKQAEAVLGQARANYFPELALTAQVDQTRLSSVDPLTGMPKDRNSLAYHKETYTLGVVASWELDVWGKLNRQSRASYADMLNSYAGRNLVQTSLISNIATSYYTLLALDKQLEVTQDMIRLLHQTLETTIAMKEAGYTTSAAIEQTRALLHSTKTSVPELEKNITHLENALSVMLGEPVAAIQRSTIANQMVKTNLSIGVPAQMLAKRPDVQQAELAFRSAFELTNASRASFYPSINLTSGLIGYSTINGLSNFFKPENLIASIAGGLTQPLFARKKLITQLNVAKAEERATLIGFEKAVLMAGKEVSDILTTYESSTKKNADRAIQVEAQKKAVADTQELLQADLATYLEVLSAQQGLLEAQLNQVNDKLEQLQAVTNLYRALGGGIN